MSDQPVSSPWRGAKAAGTVTQVTLRPKRTDVQVRTAGGSYTLPVGPDCDLRPGDSVWISVSREEPS